MTNPKVSVIVPVYNVEKYLHRCIDSILAQSFTDFELLLVNDGSKDKSGEICDEYAAKDSRVRVFHKENGGVTSARKLGFDSSVGEYVLFVDSDDYLDKDGIASLVSLSDDDVDIIIGDSLKDRVLDGAKFINEVISNNIPWALWGKLFRRSLFDAYSFDTPRYFNIGEDLIMQLKIGHNIKNVRCIKSPVYVVCENPTSATKKRVRCVEYEINFCEYVRSIIEQFKFNTEESFYKLRLESLYGLVYNGIKVSYRTEYVRSIKRDSKKYQSSIRDIILLNISWNALCRGLLHFKHFIWKTLIKS